ncbi:hypothetical protein KR100_11330 [Synechococcus sp. KORDI-100]|nr:hypothetical protein KR100_11330 [Synechococcus sp. KORDI-100]
MIWHNRYFNIISMLTANQKLITLGRIEIINGIFMFLH